MNTITVSVIIPTYNRKKLLGEALDSVLNQDFQDFEIIIVDDGSTDDTKSYIDEFYDTEKIKYFFQSNKGQNFARNNGLRNASGEYICFLDSDDLWPQNKLSLSLKVFNDNPEVDVVYGDEMIIDENGNHIEVDSIKRYSGKITEHLLVDNFIGMSSSIVKKSRVMDVGGMDESISVADDYSLWLRLSSNCTFLYLNEILGYYRLTPDQISKNIRARLASNLYIVTDFLDKNPDVISEEAKSKALCQFYSKRIRMLGVCHEYRQGIKEFFKAVSYNPLSLLPWRSLFRLFVPHEKA